MLCALSNRQINERIGKNSYSLKQKKGMSAPNYNGVAYGKLMPPCKNYKCYK